MSALHKTVVGLELLKSLGSGGPFFAPDASPLAGGEPKLLELFSS
jgi:hypothetical protein